MFEFTVGTRFYYKGKLCEVVELEDKYDYCKCSKCDISDNECDIMFCTPPSRHDGKNVCFKWIEE